jgi:hypothetical protein
MLSPDQETVLCALEDARRLLDEYIAGRRDAAWTVERLLGMLDKNDVVPAIDQMNRCRIQRLVD